MKTQPNSMAKSFGFSIHYFLILFLTNCIALVGFAQQDSISTYSSFGIFDQLTDRFGHTATWNDLLIGDDSSSSKLTSTVGMFDLYYYDGSGLEEASNTVHTQRRAVIEEMLGVFNSSWSHLINNEKVVIRFLPTNSSIVGGETYPILGSSYYITPKWTSNFSEVSDCLVAQLIQSAQNPFYTFGDYNTKGFVDSRELKFSHMDFYCNFDNFNLNTDLSVTQIGTNQIDLYSVALREFIVALGVNSLISEAGLSSSFNTHQFTRWDSYLKYQNQPLISYSSSQKKYIPNSLANWLASLGALSNNCDSLFTCSQSPSIGSGALKAVVSNCFNQGFDLNYVASDCATDSSLLEFGWKNGSVRRKLYQTDFNILEFLGYEMNGCYGNTLYNSSFCAQFSGENHFSQYSSVSPNQPFEGIIEFDSNQKIAINKIVEANGTTSSLELMDYFGGTSTFVMNNDSLEITNFKKGRYILRFQLESSQGSHSTAFAMLGLQGGEVCEGGNCNLLSNPSFEELEGPVECGVIDELSTTNINIPYVFIDCWSSFCGSPDLHFENCSNTSFDFTSGPSADDSGGNVPINPDPNNDNVLFLYSRIYNPLTGQTQSPPFEEAIQGVLSSSLVPGMTYEISMRIFRRAGGNPHLKIYFRNGEFIGDIDEIVNPVSYQLVPGPSEEILAFQENEWQTWTATFTVPNGQTNLNRIIIANEVLSLSTTNSNLRRRLFIDDVRISTTPNATLDIPQDFVCNGLITALQNFATPAGGVVSGPGVTGSTSYTFVSGLAGVGTHTITYTVTASNGCVLTATDQITVHPTVSFSNAVVTPTCGQSCSGSISVNAVLNGTGNVVYTWTGPSINTSNQNSLSLSNLCAGTYTLTAVVNGVCTYSQSYSVTSSPPPTASSVVNTDFCSEGCGNSILVTTNNPNNTISWTGGLTGFNPTNVCGGQYTATITSPQGCVSTPLVVVVNTLPTTSITVNTTQTIDASNLSYNTITITSTGYLTITTSNNSSCLIGTMIDVQSGGRLMVASAQLKFLPQAMIRVRQGGRAHIQGGLLTANCPGTFWHGIEVLGNENNSHLAVQASLINFSNPDVDGNNDQGGLKIDKNAIIERARIGVRLFTGNLNAFNQTATSSGGYITAYNATFRNNNSDVVFSRLYQENLSKLARVTFQLDGNSLDAASTIRPRVILNYTRGVTFEGCTWSNTNTNLLNGDVSNIFQMTAMSLFKSSFTVTEHITGTIKYRNKVEGFIYGIRTRDISPEDVVVQYTDFKCYRGIYATLWGENSTVGYCLFNNLNTAPLINIEIPPVFINPNSGTIWNNSVQNATLNNTTQTSSINSGPAYGLYLNSCSTTFVEYNEFALTSNNEANQRVGCYVNNCGGSDIRIHENTFRGNTFGLRSFNVNRNTNFTNIGGTVLSCNDFDFNRRHLEINANSNNPNAGINSNILFDDFTSLSNIFPQNTNSVFSNGRRILVVNTGNHQYRTRSAEIFNSSTQISGITPILVPTPNEFCGTTLTFQNRSQLVQNALNKQLELANYKDDGQTDYYKNQIESINVNNLLHRYNELIDISPALSTENILEVLQKEQDIPRSMLISILVSNASSLKNGDVLMKLEELNVPLSSWEKDSIYAAMNSIDEKEMLQIALNQALIDYRQQLYNDYLSIRNDSTIISKDSILSALREESYALNPLRSQLIKAMKNMDWPVLSSIITDLLAMTKEDTHEYKDLILLSILTEQASMYEIYLDSLQENYNGFAKDFIIPEYPLTYGMAIAIHDSFDPVPHHGDLHYEETERELRSTKPKRENFASISSFELFPNPTSEILQIETSDINLLDCSYRCLDYFGRQCRIEVVSRSERNMVLNVQHLANGQYTLELISPMKTSNHSFIVSR